MEPGLKLVITLRFLATGNSYKSLEYSFRIAHNTISKFIPEVCSAIYEEYQEELFKVLSTLAEWLSIALNYSTKDYLEFDDNDIRYFLVGDDAFPLRTWMIKTIHFQRKNYLTTDCQEHGAWLKILLE